MKIAMFCIEFPPINTTGNYRSAGIARSLIKKKIETLVFTVDENTGFETFKRNIDNNLLWGLENVKIYRFPILPFKSIWTNKLGNALRIWWNTTDKIDKRWFLGSSKKKIIETIENQKPDVIYFSFPPFSLARVAIYLTRKTGIPLIVDMRDAMSLWGTSSHQSFIHYTIKKRLERKLFESATRIIGVTPELVKDFKKQHPDINEKKFEVVYNGYDCFEVEEENKSSNTYIIGYVGSFYYSPNAELKNKKVWYKRGVKSLLSYAPRKEQWIYRSPYFFLKALSKLLAENRDIQNRIRFEYIGSAPHWLQEMISEFSLDSIFTNHGFRSKSDVLSIQKDWSAVLATSEKIEGADHFCLPSKIFDSIKLQKRILAFVTEGSQKNFLKEYPQTVFFDPDEVKQNVATLLQTIEEGSDYEKNALSESFTREAQNEKVIQIIKSVV